MAKEKQQPIRLPESVYKDSSKDSSKDSLDTPPDLSLMPAPVEFEDTRGLKSSDAKVIFGWPWVCELTDGQMRVWRQFHFRMGGDVSLYTTEGGNRVLMDIIKDVRGLFRLMFTPSTKKLDSMILPTGPAKSVADVDLFFMQNYATFNVFRWRFIKALSDATRPHLAEFRSLRVMAPSESFEDFDPSTVLEVRLVVDAIKEFIKTCG
jgi:hypothetical protein